MKKHIKSTYPKILFLFLSSCIFFIVLYFSLYRYAKKAELEVYNTNKELFHTEINKLFFLDSKPIEVAIYNDTNWDEFVNFLSSKNTNWYEDNLANEIETYDVDYLGTYDINKNFVIHTSSSKIKSIDIIPKQVFSVLHKKGLIKFYMNIPEGIIEVFGASIFPSDIAKRKIGKEFGYFFVGRLIEKSFIKNLESVSNSNIELVSNTIQFTENRGFITTQIPLLDYNGKIVSNLVFNRVFPVFFDNLLNILYLIILAFIINLIINLIFTRKWVYHPLELVTRILETGNTKAIYELIHSTGEFRRIGKLFEENSNQKKELIDAKIKAEEGERLKSSFLANLSHEIRTPMNAINGFTDLLINTKLSKEENLEYLKIIESSGKNLVSIIDDLIEMSKIESHQITPNFTTLNLDTCLSELFETIKITIPITKKIDFRIFETQNPSKHLIQVDEIKLKQVLINIVNNAIKFTEIGFVAFGYEIDEKNAKIVFRIEDTGIGIDEYQHKHIFDRFKRLESDISIKVGGLGLGLAISKAYVEMMGGEISLESKINKGSVFTITIPLIYNTNARIKVKTINEIGVSKIFDKVTILIAEDDNINFILFNKIIQIRNYEIIRAVNGQEAIDICINNPNIDLVLMDIKMPILNGYEAFEKIKQIRPSLAVIAQTAYSSMEDEENIFKAGFYGYLTKPINREKLFEMMDEVLEKK
ncbi:ATP-binding protein [Flavobacterium sp.]|uniref:ATP-binding protein n=1 Tax=Flavobacterium sp. TaxID=239 RepID=UPI0038FC6FBE